MTGPSVRRRAVVLDRSGGKAVATEAGEEIIDVNDWDLTLVVDRPPRRRLPGGVEVVAVGDFDEDRIRAAVHAAHRERPIDRLSTSSEFFLTTIAALRDELGIPGKGYDYTRRVRDKWLMKMRSRTLGLRCMDGAIATDLSAWASARPADGRLVIKPRWGSGARGVSVAADSEQALAVTARLDKPGDFLVEDFNPAPMLHIDGIVWRSDVLLQVSRYLRPCHVSGGSIPLSSVTSDDRATVERATHFVKQLVAAWPIFDDVFHCEVFDTPEGVTLCEIAARPGGAGVVDVFRGTRGVDLRHAKTLLDLGLEPWARWAPTMAHGGWTVFYAPGLDRFEVDDGTVSGHATREVLGLDEPRINDIAGVGVATYSFLADTAQEVLASIDRYERNVIVRKIA